MSRNIVLKDYNSINWSDIFYYDPTSKTCLRSKIARPKKKVGDEVGSFHTTKGKTYATVSWNSTNWFAHRVIWIILNGGISRDNVIDHINGDSSDNRIENLRMTTQDKNNRNSSLRHDNSTGISGVHFTTSSDKKGGVYTYATSTWYSVKDKGTHRECKHFSVNKLGLLEAFAQACKFRESKISELNTLGCEYSDSHGK